MAKGEKITGGPFWTQNWIEAMWRFTAERFVDFDTGAVDFEALGREEFEFRKALFFRNFKNSPRAREAFEAAADDYSKKVANGQKGGRPRKSITADGELREDSQAKPDGSAITRNETRAHDALDTSATISAGAPTREDGEFKSDGSDAATLKSGTSANIYATRQAKNGDADTREGSEDCTCRESGAQSPTTISNISQDAAHRKAADDCKALTSCNHYDQGIDRRISTDEALDLLRAGVTAKRPAPTRRGSAMPSDVGEVYAFASAEGLDSADAYECWSATVERGGKTADGKPVKNWKAYVRRWCATRAEKRRTA